MVSPLLTHWRYCSLALSHQNTQYPLTLLRSCSVGSEFQWQRTWRWLWSCTMMTLHSPHFTSEKSSTSVEICMSGMVTLALTRITTIGPPMIYWNRRWIFIVRKKKKTTVGTPYNTNVGVQKIPDRAIWKPVVAKRNITNPWSCPEPQILVTRDSRQLHMA